MAYVVTVCNQNFTAVYCGGLVFESQKIEIFIIKATNYIHPKKPILVAIHTVLIIVCNRKMNLVQFCLRSKP